MQLMYGCSGRAAPQLSSCALHSQRQREGERAGARTRAQPVYARLAKATAPEPQRSRLVAAAICIRTSRRTHDTEVLLVSSRDGSGFVFPKVRVAAAPRRLGAWLWTTLSRGNISLM